MKSIWDKIKLAFDRKPAGNILLPDLPIGTNITVTLPPQKPKRVRKTKNEST